MPAGLQVWDASGNLIVDTSTLLARVLGIISTTSGVANSTSNAALATGTAFYLVMATSGWAFPKKVPEVSFSGTTISWTAAAEAVKILYGVC